MKYVVYELKKTINISTSLIYISHGAPTFTTYIQW